MKKIRILNIITNFIPETGGPYNNVLELSAELIKMGHDVEIFATTSEQELLKKKWIDVGTGEEKVKLKITYFYHFCQKLCWSASFLKAINKNTKNFDFFLIHGLRRFPVTYAARVAERKGIKYLLFTHSSLYSGKMGSSSFFKNLYFNFFDKKTIQKANAVFVMSDREKHVASTVCDPCKTFVLNSGISDDQLERNCSIVKEEKDVFLIVYIGRILEDKGLLHLVSEIEILNKNLPANNFVLKIHGFKTDSNFFNKLSKVIREKNLSQKIQLLGPVFGQEKDELLRQSDLFVLPTFHDACPRALIEAMSYKIPVITTPNCLLPVDIDGRAGYVAGFERGLMAKLMIKLMTDNDLWKKFGGHGFETLRKNFAWSIIANRVMRELK